MSITHTITKKVVVGSNTYQSVITRTAGAGVEISESIPDSSTDLEVACALDISQLKSIWIKATGGALTIETNDGTTPTDTLSLVDGEAIAWEEGDESSLFLSGDVTALFVTNASGASVLLELIALLDPTV